MHEISITGDWRAYHEDLRASVGDTYQGRPLVFRDMDVTGGVIYEKSEDTVMEALVVDPTEDPEPYDRLYDAVLADMTVSGLIRAHRFVPAIYKHVRRVLPYASEKIGPLLGEVAIEHGQRSFQNGTAVNLGRFLRARVGSCRQQAAAMCATAERLRDEKSLNFGRISFDSNAITYRDGSEAAHAWMRMGHSKYRRDSVIIDASNEYHGRLSKAYQLRRSRRIQWPYWRPEDMPYLLSL